MSTTFLSLYQYAQRQYHNRSDPNAVAVCKESVNRALRRIAERDHPHFIKQGYINLVAAYSSGTVAVSEGGTTVSGTSCTWSSAMEGRYMKIEDEQVHFLLSTWASAAGFTFDGGAKWLNDAETAGEYVIYKDTYDLPTDFRTAGDLMEKTQLRGVTWLNDESEWYRKKMENYALTGAPQWACLAGDKLKLWPYETDLSVISFLYYYWPEDLSADDDPMDFPDNQIDLVRAAIRLEVAIERGKGAADAEAAFEKKQFQIEGAATNPHATFAIGGGGGGGLRTPEYTIGDDE